MGPLLAMFGMIVIEYFFGEEPVKPAKKERITIYHLPSPMELERQKKMKADGEALMETCRRYLK